MFVSRENRQLDIAGLDDPRLRRISIGVHMVGDDFSNTPSAHSPGEARHRAERTRVQGARRRATDSLPRAIIAAVAKGEIDTAIVWGPVAGYFAKKSSTPLSLTAVSPRIDGPMLPMTFDISMGVRKEDRSASRARRRTRA